MDDKRRRGGHRVGGGHAARPQRRFTAATRPRFLENVAPPVDVISVGEANPCGPPAEVVVERYNHDGVRLGRTDRHGEVTVQTDGKSFEVPAFAGGDTRVSGDAAGVERPLAP